MYFFESEDGAVLADDLGQVAGETLLARLEIDALARRVAALEALLGATVAERDAARVDLAHLRAQRLAWDRGLATLVLLQTAAPLAVMGITAGAHRAFWNWRSI
jgi:hypothetical protein